MLFVQRTLLNSGVQWPSGSHFLFQLQYIAYDIACTSFLSTFARWHLCIAYRPYDRMQYNGAA